MKAEEANRFSSLAEFYPFYLREHSDPTCRALHYIGSTLVLILIAGAIILPNYWLLLFILPAGYGFAWIGHFGFEKNKPATFQYPFYSLISDWIMYYNYLTGNLGTQLRQAGVYAR